MSYYSKIILHMILMLIFLSFSSAGVITARFYKKKNPKWLKIHKLLMLGSLISAAAGLIWIIIVVQSVSGFHFSSPHTIYGLITFLLALTAPILGFSLMSKKTDNEKKPLLRKFHKIIGWISLILILGTVLSGLILFGIISLPF